MSLSRNASTSDCPTRQFKHSVVSGLLPEFRWEKFQQTEGCLRSIRTLCRKQRARIEGLHSVLCAKEHWQEKPSSSFRPWFSVTFFSRNISIFIVCHVIPFFSFTHLRIKEANGAYSVCREMSTVSLKVLPSLAKDRFPYSLMILIKVQLF